MNVLVSWHRAGSKAPKVHFIQVVAGKYGWAIYKREASRLLEYAALVGHVAFVETVLAYGSGKVVDEALLSQHGPHKLLTLNGVFLTVAKCRALESIMRARTYPVLLEALQEVATQDNASEAPPSLRVASLASDGRISRGARVRSQRGS